MINGSYFDGKTSDKKDVSLYYTTDGLIGINDIDFPDFYFNEIQVSSRIGNTARYINFPNGSLFESIDNDAIDSMILELSDQQFQGLAHKLESAKAFIFFTIISVILFTWVFIQHGVPYFSKQIAHMLPQEASQYIGQGVLEVMDKSLFSESKLSEKKQEELRSIFNNLLNDIEGSEDYKLLFRAGGQIQANAFALPDGTIVFTDELINLAENNLEITSIMLHEIGHLQHLHSLRATIQQFSLAMFVMVITGDVSSSSSIITAIPVMLVESGFSQDMETEADTYSLQYMQQHKIDPEYFAIMMEKLEASFRPEYVLCMENATKQVNKIQCIKNAVKLNREENSKETKSTMDYFSTHPASRERTERFRSNK